MFYGTYMKKINNKYRSNNNNSSNSTIYSLNYKFDSNSIAGKISGTALDLIKRYNDFAKDAQSNNDYVNAEIFRQYAEHYRKIVTEINERKNQQRQAYAVENGDNRLNAGAENLQETNPSAEENTTIASEQPAENKPAAEPVACAAEKTADEAVKNAVKANRKSFKIIEISHAKADEAVAVPPAEEPTAASDEAAPKRVYRRRKTAASS